MAGEFVDNSGQGDCMYNAYAISLMHFLLQTRDKEIAERIFCKLALSEDNKALLHSLLNDDKRTNFTKKENKTIIEPILMQKLREAAFEQIKAGFIKDPKASSLWQSTQYGMVYALRKELEKVDSPLASLISTYTFDGNSDFAQDYIHAEVFRVFHAEDFIQQIAPNTHDIIEKFNTQWPSKAQEILATRLNTLKISIKENIENQHQFIARLLDEDKLIFGEVVKGFELQWQNYLQQLLIETDYGLFPIEEVAADKTLQLAFIKLLLPARFPSFDEIMGSPGFNEEWKQRVETLYIQQSSLKEELKSNSRLQEQFIRELEALCAIEDMEYEFSNALPKIKPFVFQEIIQIDSLKKLWEHRIDQLYKDQCLTKEELGANNVHQKQFRAEVQKRICLQFSKIIKDHVEEWDAFTNELYQSQSQSLTLEQISKDPFYQQDFLVDLVQESTTEFFTKNNFRNLDRYVEHIRQPRIWGSEETLVLLHNYLRGEEDYRDEQGLVQRRVETDVTFKISAGDNGNSGAELKRPDMVLINRGNYHWLSYVHTISARPLADLVQGKIKTAAKDSEELVTYTGEDTQALAKTDKLLKSEQHSEENGTGDKTLESDQDTKENNEVQEEHSLDDKLLTTENTGEQEINNGYALVDPDKDTVSQSTTKSGYSSLFKADKRKSDNRVGELEICGFKQYMEQLKAKAEGFKTTHPKVSAEAWRVYNELDAMKTKFLAHDSTMTTEEFSNGCKPIINGAKQGILKDHRGINLIFNGLLNALIFLANSALKLWNGRPSIDSDRIKTKSIQAVDGIENSITALIAMREREDSRLKASQEESSLSEKESSYVLVEQRPTN